MTTLCLVLCFIPLEKNSVYKCGPPQNSVLAALVMIDMNGPDIVAVDD
jgi:hypothetical protein